jgi:hypothetical protein
MMNDGHPHSIPRPHENESGLQGQGFEAFVLPKKQHIYYHVALQSLTTRNPAIPVPAFHAALRVVLSFSSQNATKGLVMPF